MLGLPPSAVQVLLCLAGFLCCVPMALPASHLVAFCSDLGIPATQGAAMLSVMLGCAFVSRQFWGWFGDRHGGLLAVLAGSACQATAIGCFLLTQSEAGLFAVVAAYGLGFSGIIPSYVLAVRELFPSSQAAWRCRRYCSPRCAAWHSEAGWAGRWTTTSATTLPAFGAGVVFNLGNLVVVGLLVWRQRRGQRWKLPEVSLREA